MFKLTPVSAGEVVYMGTWYPTPWEELPAKLQEELTEFGKKALQVFVGRPIDDKLVQDATWKIQKESKLWNKTRKDVRIVEVFTEIAPGRFSIVFNRVEQLGLSKKVFDKIPENIRAELLEEHRRVERIKLAQTAIYKMKDRERDFEPDEYKYPWNGKPSPIEFLAEIDKVNKTEYPPPFKVIEERKWTVFTMPGDLWGIDRSLAAMRQAAKAYNFGNRYGKTSGIRGLSGYIIHDDLSLWGPRLTINSAKEQGHILSKPKLAVDVDWPAQYMGEYVDDIKTSLKKTGRYDSGESTDRPRAEDRRMGALPRRSARDSQDLRREFFSLHGNRSSGRHVAPRPRMGRRSRRP